MNNRTIGRLDRAEYIRIAEELRYPPEIIEGLKKAETVEECERLMFKGRHTY